MTASDKITVKVATPTDNPRRAFKINDFCEAYGISRATTYKLIKTGKLRTVVVGGRRLVPTDEAERLLLSE
jgi:excisionase family DNA binding protein